MRGPGRIVVLLVALALSVARAHAVSILDFGMIAPTTGTISYAGGVAPLVGVGIDVDNIVGLPGGPTLACVGCVLNFTTGNLTSSTATTWDFGGGPLTTITITGAVPGALVPPATVLLSGAFGNATVLNLGGVFKIAGAGFLDTKDPILLAFFGLPVGIPYYGNFNLSFQAAGSPPGAFTSTTMLSGDLTNTPTPEPGSMMLLGSGLAGFVYLARARKRGGK